MKDEQVERVAKAIAEWFACPWPFLLDAQREGYRSEARVAIAAMQPDMQAVRNAALREAAGLAEVLAVEMEAYNSIPTTTTKSKAMCIRERILALVKENDDEG